MGGVSRIVNVAEETDQRTGAVGEFMQVVLAQDDGTGLAQPAHHFGTLRGNTVLKQLTGCSRAYARSIDQIFKCDWDSVQRSTPFAAADLIFGRACLGQSRFGRHGDKSVQRRIQLFYAFQASARQLNRGDFSSPQPRRKLNDGFQVRHGRERPL